MIFTLNGTCSVVEERVTYELLNERIEISGNKKGKCELNKLQC